MKIFFTGASGFVGSYALREAVRLGNQTAVLLRKNSNTNRIDDLLPHVDIIHGDLNDVNSYINRLDHFAPDAIVHCGWTGVMNTDRNSLHQTENVHNSAELVKAAAKTKAGIFIGLGSQAEYGPCSNIIDEYVPKKPTTIYGASKLAACTLCKALCNDLGLRFTWLRLFSSYGPKDHETWMIPYLIRSLFHGERPSLTKGEQLWDYIFIEDVARAITAATESAEAEGTFNIGSGKAYPLRDIIQQVRDAIDPELPLGFGEVSYRPDQVMHLQADITKFSETTGWSPVIELESGLYRTVEWYREQICT